MAVITVSRQLGSWGDEVAQRVAIQLGYRLMDRALIAEAAQRAGVDVETIRDMDERGLPSLATRTAEYLWPRFRPEPMKYTLDEMRVLDQRFYMQLVTEIIEQVARADNVVIVGRGAQMVLRTNPNTVHAKIVAAREDRIQRCSEVGYGTYAECERAVDASDRNRASYLRSFFGVDWLDPALYDVTINTSRISVESAADAVVACLPSRTARDTPANTAG